MCNNKRKFQSMAHQQSPLPPSGPLLPFGLAHTRELDRSTRLNCNQFGRLSQAGRPETVARANERRRHKRDNKDKWRERRHPTDASFASSRSASVLRDRNVGGTRAGQNEMADWRANGQHNNTHLIANGNATQLSIT